MPKTLVRPARASDIGAITAIYRPAVLHGTASFELEPPDEAEMLRRHAALVDAGFPYLVGELDGRVAGYAYAGFYRPRPAYRYSVEDSVYIAPEMQGRGVGRALLTELIRICSEKRFRQMIAVIGDSQQHASIGLHRTLGFKLAGVVRSVGFKHGRWLDQVLMQRALGPGDTAPP